MSETSTSQMPEDQLPQEVVAKLCGRSVTPISVPTTMDEAILADARSVLHDVVRPKHVQPRRRSWTIGLVSVGSLAAALLIAVMSQWNVPDLQSQPARSIDKYTMSDADSFGSTVFQREDVDRNGNVDILDAFALARRVRRSDTDLVSGDQNGDGVINEADVEWIAMSAVML
ncbi:MAG TPA: hypothetical protein EYG03_24995 [Planctomycetes bacterium]|nr:hypothetical protein [Fuerstiella sp.]HIK95213.1 hypothetical protein [Planctomycetota bacterium]